MPDYEIDYEGFFTYRIFLILVIVAIAGFYLGVPYVQSHYLAPKNVTVEVVTPVPTSDAIQIEYVYITVTPTPDGINYYVSEYQNGTRLLKREFTIDRKDVLGKKDMVLHANTYDYRIFNSYHWFNPTDYKYYEEYPSKADKKFLFVFTYIYMDEVLGGDPRFWIPQVKQFSLQSQNKMYYPIDFLPQLRIKELEDTFNSNGDSAIQYYNSIRKYSSSKSTIVSAGEYSEAIDVLKGGKSNKIDGYIVFEIDKEDKPEDIIFHGNYYGLGYAGWRLEGKGLENR